MFYRGPNYITDAKRHMIELTVKGASLDPSLIKAINKYFKEYFAIESINYKTSTKNITTYVASGKRSGIVLKPQDHGHNEKCMCAACVKGREFNKRTHHARYVCQTCQREKKLVKIAAEKDNADATVS